jgi:hypothetical protein
MSNRILPVCWHSSLDQAGASADVRVEIVPERPGPDIEVRGRLMGPRCPFASTVEVAYPLRPLGPQSARAIIPEASLWDPESPFLYHGPIELWQGGQRIDRAEVTVGLRHVTLGPRGLFINGRPTRLHGRELAACTPEEALGMRAEGVNLWVVPGAEAEEALWALADQLGFLVLGRLGPVGPEWPGWVEKREQHPSCLGWLVEASPDITRITEAARSRGVHVGLVYEAGTPVTDPSHLSFVACTPADAGEAARLGLPILGLGGEAEGPLAVGHVAR